MAAQCQFFKISNPLLLIIFPSYHWFSHPSYCFLLEVGEKKNQALFEQSKLKTLLLLWLAYVSLSLYCSFLALFATTIILPLTLIHSSPPPKHPLPRLCFILLSGSPSILGISLSSLIESYSSSIFNLVFTCPPKQLLFSTDISLE